MKFQEIVISKLQQVPENERMELLILIDKWINRHQNTARTNIDDAVATVRNSWATFDIDPKILHWCANSVELEYEPL